MPPDLALLSILIGSNYPSRELIFIVPKVFEPLKFFPFPTESKIRVNILFAAYLDNLLLFFKRFQLSEIRKTSWRPPNSHDLTDSARFTQSLLTNIRIISIIKPYLFVY